MGIEDGRFKYQDITTKSLTSATAPSPLPGLAKPVPTTSLLPVAVVAENVEDTETTQLIPGSEVVVVDDVKPVFELNLSVDFPIGGLTIVVGATGSGKTSLFLALLGGASLFAQTFVCDTDEASRCRDGLRRRKSQSFER